MGFLRSSILPEEETPAQHVILGGVCLKVVRFSFSITENNHENVRKIGSGKMANVLREKARRPLTRTAAEGKTLATPPHASAATSSFGGESNDHSKNIFIQIKKQAYV